MYLSAAVVLVGALCLFNLLLCLGVVRRLREHTELLQRLAGASSDVAVAVGATVGAFAATTTAGRLVTRDSLDRPTLVGFFTPGCPPCQEQVPLFVAYGARFDGAVLAVAVGEPDETRELVRRLAGTMEVVVEPAGGPVANAFGVTGFPALCVLDPTGQVLASGTATGELPATVAA